MNDRPEFLAQLYVNTLPAPRTLMLQDSIDMASLAADIKAWGKELGFQQVAIADIHLEDAAQRLAEWLAKDYQGDMAWLGDHGSKRWRPELLLPGTQRVIVARLDYLPANTRLIQVLRDPDKAYISRYALGRDYHKLIRKRLASLAARIETAAPNSIVQRPFVDSAPVLEKPLAE